MSDGPRAWSPRTGRWQTASGDRPPRAYAALDSWLVQDGRVRGLARHRARFAAAVTATGAFGEADVGCFLDAAVAALPVRGRWFPRVELTADRSELRLWLRPAPAAEDGLVVFATPFPDPRAHPCVKGPDLACQTALRAQVEAFAAGEALLAAPDGTVTEGVWTALLWWEGDVLCALPRGAPVLDSVTRALVLGLACEAGVAVGRGTPSIARLRAGETWLLSALHGIRVVSAWLLVPGEAPARAPAVPGRRSAWQARLDALAVPVVPESTASSDG